MGKGARRVNSVCEAGAAGGVAKAARGSDRARPGVGEAGVGVGIAGIERSICRRSRTLLAWATGELDRACTCAFGDQQESNV